MIRKTIFLAAILALLSSPTFGQDEEAALEVGNQAPDFELATFDDQTVTLSERAGEDGKPVILLFSRANW